MAIIRTSTRLIIFLLVAVLGLSGCENTGITSRIKEKTPSYARLTPAQQATIMRGGITIGFTPDMVYMALGKPFEFKFSESPEGDIEMWVYEDYGRVDPTGSIVRGTGNTIPTALLPYLPRTDLILDSLLVVFVNGRVSAVKQAKANL
ncbi:MAG: hypothetical protein K9M98_14200 [Cephaloticoccus sp.]|nr:hypothetical protein [Cephaloticoccus sp.]MCF7761647.1 hypothetical protein [Cephaloticoccus sp.]